METIESSVNSENQEMQTEYQKKIVKNLTKIFNVDNQGLGGKMQEGTDLERAILRTAIQGDRPIESVKEIAKVQSVDVDKGKNVENISIPEGTLKIVYGKRDDDAAGLIVYVWKNDNNTVQHGVSAIDVDYEKVLRNAVKEESSSGPNYIEDRHVNQSPDGSSSLYPDSDSIVDAGSKKPSHV